MTVSGSPWANVTGQLVHADKIPHTRWTYSSLQVERKYLEAEISSYVGLLQRSAIGVKP